MEAPQDLGFWQWLISGIGGIGAVALGYMNIKFDRLDGENKEDHIRMLAETRSNAQIMWDQIEHNKRDMEARWQTILTHMSTKEDVRETERRIMEAIKAK